MKRILNRLTLISILLIPALFLTTCEEKCNCVYPEEHIPEYHMTFNFVSTPDDNDTVYVITINTKTHEVIDSVASTDIPPFTDMVFIEGGDKALIAGQENLYIEDVVTHDTLAISPISASRLILSNDEEYVTYVSGGIEIISLPDLNIIDNFEDITAIGIDGENHIAYGFKYATNFLYRIEYSEIPAVTTEIEIYNGSHRAPYLRFCYLSSNNETLLLFGMDETGYESLMEFDADSLYFRSEIAQRGIILPVWTSDDNICFGTFDGNVVKYNTATNVYSTIIDKESIIIPDVAMGSDYFYGHGFYASYVRLTADNKHLYIQLSPRCEGPCGGYNGSTLVYDLNTREIIHRYDYTKYGWNVMVVNPKDWSL